MANIVQRIGRLEKTLRGMGGGLCRACYGTPIAVLYVESEVDPNGPGFRDTGVVILDAHWAERISDDLCCIACGKRAVRMMIRTHKEIDETRAGRRLVNFEREAET